MLGRRRRGLVVLACAATVGGGALAAPPTPAQGPAAPAPPPASGPAGGETIDQALCRLIEGAAAAQRLPAAFLTRLIWRESSFRPGATSSAGAQGVAQFMPGTAAERGLLDPFDPEQAIPKSAELLADLSRRFGNLGLAAAAYNGGPGRVAAWLEGRGGLPTETRQYVLAITGRSAEEWVAARAGSAGAAETPAVPETGASPPSRPASCLTMTAALRRGRGGGDALFAGTGGAPTAPLAPWGVQLAGNFSKDVALASFARARRSYTALLGEVQPMVIGTRMRNRGTRTFYRVRVPAETRTAATALCDKIRATGGACVVLPS